MIRIWRLGTLLAAAVFAAASPGASAQGLSNTIYVNQSLPLQVPVIASVGGRCEFRAGDTPQGNYDAGEIDTLAWQNDFPFVIQCNTASRVAVVSTNGGLKNSSAVLDAGYTNLAPYAVQLVLQGNSTGISADCPVDALLVGAAGPCAFRGPASTTDGLRLPGPSLDQSGSYLRVSAPAYPPGSALIAGNTLVAGNYADTLTITIAAAP